MADETGKGTALAGKDAAIAAAYRAILDGDTESLPAPADPEAMSRAIVERIINSDTFEEAFQPQALPAWRDLLGLPVLVRDVHLNRSTVEGGGSGIYAVCDLERLDDGEAITVTCGGRNVLAQLVLMLEKGWMDKPVKMTARDTQEGFKALWLEAA